ncbi:MAG: glycosyltransferase family 2 protein [Bdellovibrionales bacterium]
MSVEKYVPEREFLNNRRYFVPLSEMPPVGLESEGAALGWYEPDVTEEAVLRKAQKALSGKYTHFLLPPTAPLSKKCLPILTILERFQLPIVLQVLSSSIGNSSIEAAVIEKAHSVQIVIDEWNDRIQGLLQMLDLHQEIEFALLLTTKTSFADVKKFTKTHNVKVLNTICPAKLDSNDVFLTPKQAHKFTRQCQTHAELKLLGPTGIELYEPRSASDATLEATYTPTFTLESTQPAHEKRISVVIPTYNNGPYLVRTLEHLFDQDLQKDYFEVIVVDDGSSDNTLDLIQSKFKNNPYGVNFKYIHFPRNKQRKMGDSQFRAGVSRNLGTKHATGEYLLFLDSDILTPKWFLTDLLTKHQKWDVIQGRRYDLTKDAARVKKVNYESVDHEKDTFVTDKGYWVDFYDRCTDWNDLPACWKYVCTHSLSMRRSVYESVGWIKKTFIYYGFEDTDLGYRLVKSGYKLHLNETKLYHLFHQDERSEFDNSDIRRHEILSKTAQIFYRNHFDDEIYRELSVFMKSPFDPNFITVLFSLTWVSTIFKYLIVKPISLVFHILLKIAGVALLPLDNDYVRRTLNRTLYKTVVGNQRGFITVLPLAKLDTRPELISTDRPRSDSIPSNNWNNAFWALWAPLHLFVRCYFSLTRNPPSVHLGMGARLFNRVAQIKAVTFCWFLLQNDSFNPAPFKIIFEQNLFLLHTQGGP